MWTIEMQDGSVWSKVSTAGPYRTRKAADKDCDFMRDRNSHRHYRVVEATDEPPAAQGPCWYETQERAMAPGIGDGWPSVIRPQHSGNARLVKRTGSPELAFLACQLALERLERLHGISHGDEVQAALRAALASRGIAASAEGRAS